MPQYRGICINPLYCPTLAPGEGGGGVGGHDIDCIYVYTVFIRIEAAPQIVAALE